MLRLVTAWSSESLSQWLADWFSQGPTDPFARELVVVPTPGMERYVTRRLASRLGVSEPGSGDGVCAAVDFVQPDDLMAAVLAARLDADDPWAPGVLQWHCLQAVDDLSHRDEERFLGLQHRLRPGTAGARRMALARDVARLLGKYCAQRPELLLEWAAGDTSGTPVQHRWQADVFQHVLARTGTPPWPLRVRELISEGIGEAEVPARLAVFGVTRFGTLELEFLRALASDREVAVLMVDHSWHGPDSQLITTLGGEERFALRAIRALEPSAQRLEDYPATADTLLHRLQLSICTDAAMPPDAPRDDTLTVHGCAGPLRQVEVLRDQVLSLLAKDPTLQARDVLVMCTDLEVYAPLIAQVLGTTSAPVGGPTRDLHVSLADRVARIDNPVLQVVQTLVGLVGARMTAAEVLDLIELPSVAGRFGLDAQDHHRLEQLVASVDIRWGLDPAHRDHHGVTAGAGHTWQWGLDRLAVATAVAPDDLALVNGVAPAADVGEDDVHLVGVLDAVVTVLTDAWSFARCAHPARLWAESLSAWVEALVADEWRSAAAVAAVSAALDSDVDVGLGEIAMLLEADLGGFGPRPRVLAGGVDVVAMRPMRNIPYRVVCLLGMDDGTFPRETTLGGDDVLGVAPRPGERDPRAEDRQLFLDAVCAAQQHLVITYSSRNIVSGHPLPPAAPLAELLDVVGDIVHSHPVTAHDARNFAVDPEHRIATSFDRPAAAFASADTRGSPPLRDARTVVMPADVTVDELIAFWRNPARAFLRHLGVPVDREEDPPDHELPIDMDGLAKWKVGDELLRRDRDLSAAREIFTARGALPAVGASEAWDEIGAKVTRVREVATRLGDAGAEYARLELPLDPRAGTVLTGALRHPVTGTLVDASYSRSKPADVLALRIRIAALSAAGIPVPGVLVRPSGRRVNLDREKPWAQSEAALWLRTLAYLRHVGLTRPLPFAVTTSAAYAAALPEIDESRKEARSQWAGVYGRPGERLEPEYRMLWDGDWDTLVSVPPLPDTWLPRHDSLFGQLADLVLGRRP